VPESPAYDLLDDEEPGQAASVVESSISDLSGVAPDEALVVMSDLIRSLAPSFLPASGASVFEANDAVRGGFDSGPIRLRVLDQPARDSVVAVQYNTVNTGHYHSILPTNREITFEAILIEHRETNTISRYIDWNFVMAQLGIVGTQRPTLGLGPNGDGIVFPAEDTVAAVDEARPVPDLVPWWQLISDLLHRIAPSRR
jgi:hypothetical protein